MINYWQTVYWAFDTMSLIENVSLANVSPAWSSSDNIKLFNQGTLCWVKKMISYHLDLTCNKHDQAWRLPGNLSDETHRLDRYRNATNVTPVLLIGFKCLLFLPLCHWCKHYAKLLESERHLSNRDFGFWAVYFPAELDGAAAQKTEIYLVSETENIDQKHVLLREDKHASFIPHCQFSLRQKALESTTTGLGW